MNKLNIHEAKTHLSEYLAELKPGEIIVLCKRNTPIAEIRRLPEPSESPRPIGLAREMFQVPASFLEPLPEEILSDFEGKAA